MVFTDFPNDIDADGPSNQFVARGIYDDGTLVPENLIAPIELSLTQVTPRVEYTATGIAQVTQAGSDIFIEEDHRVNYILVSLGNLDGGANAITNSQGGLTFADAPVNAPNINLTPDVANQINTVDNVSNLQLQTIEIIGTPTTNNDGITTIEWEFDFTQGVAAAVLDAYEQNTITTSMFTTGNTALDAAIVSTTGDNAAITPDTVFSIQHFDNPPSSFSGLTAFPVCGLSNNIVSNIDYNIGFTITSTIPAGFTGEFAVRFKPVADFADNEDVLGRTFEQVRKTGTPCQSTAFDTQLQPSTGSAPNRTIDPNIQPFPILNVTRAGTETSAGKDDIIQWTLTFTQSEPNNVDTNNVNDETDFSNQFVARLGSSSGTAIPIKVNGSGSVYTARIAVPEYDNSLTDTYGLYATADYGDNVIITSGGNLRFGDPPVEVTANVDLTPNPDQRFLNLPQPPTSTIQLERIFAPAVSDPDANTGAIRAGWSFRFGSDIRNLEAAYVRSSIVKSMFSTGNAALDAAIADPNNPISQESVFTDTVVDGKVVEVIRHNIFVGNNLKQLRLDTTCGVATPNTTVDFGTQFAIDMTIPAGFTGTFIPGFRNIEDFPEGVDVIGHGTDTIHGTNRACRVRVPEQSQLVPSGLVQSHTIDPAPPALLFVEKPDTTTKNVRRGDTVTWNLVFAGIPDGSDTVNLASTSPQFEARAIDSAGDIIDSIDPIPLRLTELTPNSVYTATGQIATANTDETINYGLFPASDLSGDFAGDAIINPQGGLRFANAALTETTINLTPDIDNQYDNLAPIPPTLTITTTSSPILAPDTLVWKFNFVGLGETPPSNIINDPSTQFAVCYDHDNIDTTDDLTLDLTLVLDTGTTATTGITYTATSDPTIPYSTDFSYNICALDVNEVTRIESPSGGLLTLNGTQVASDAILTDNTNNIDNDPTPISNLQLQATTFSDESSNQDGSVTTRWTFTFTKGGTPDILDAFEQESIDPSMFSTGNTILDDAIRLNIGNNGTITSESVFTEINFLSSNLSATVDDTCGDATSETANPVTYQTTFGLTMVIPSGFIGEFSPAFKNINTFRTSGDTITEGTTPSTAPKTLDVIGRGLADGNTGRPCRVSIDNQEQLTPITPTVTYSIGTHPSLTVSRNTQTTQSVTSRGDLIWTLDLTNEPTGVAADSPSPQFVARAIYTAASGNFPSDATGNFPPDTPPTADGTTRAGTPRANASREGILVPDFPPIAVAVSRVTENVQYTARANLFKAHSDATVTYALFPIAGVNLSSQISNTAADGSTVQPLQFADRALTNTNPPTNLTPLAEHQYINVPPIIPTLIITRSPSLTGSVPAGTELKWDFNFTNLGTPSTSLVSLANPSTQFGVCYDGDDDPNNALDTLSLTLTEVTKNSEYTATSTATPLNTRDFSYHVCALNNITQIQSPTRGALAATLSVGGSPTELASDDRLTIVGTNDFTNDPPRPPVLTIRKTDSTILEVRTNDTISWDLEFTGTPTGIRTSNQFIAKPSDSNLSDIPLTLSQVILNTRYTASGTITSNNDLTGVTYSIFPAVDLNTAGVPNRISNIAGGLTFDHDANDTTPLIELNLANIDTELSFEDVNKFNYLPPIIPTLRIEQDISDTVHDPANHAAGNFLGWELVFTGEPVNITVGGESDQFQVCYSGGQILPVTVTGNGPTYSAKTTDVIPLRAGDFNFNLCTHENLNNNVIRSPSTGVLVLQGTTTQVNRNGQVLTDTTNDFTNDPPNSPTFLNVARVGADTQRVTAANTIIEWNVSFGGNVRNVDITDFSINSGIITQVTPTNARIYKISARITGSSPNGDTNIHLTRVNGSNIELTDASSARFPAGSQQVTNDPTPTDGDDSNDNYFIFNTDTTGPTITSATDITRVSATNSPNGIVTASSEQEIQWDVVFSETIDIGDLDKDNFVLNFSRPANDPSQVDIVSVGSITGVVCTNSDITDPTNRTTCRVTAQATGTPTDTRVDLALADTVSITDVSITGGVITAGNANAFRNPSFIDGRIITTTDDNRYIFNTDTNPAVLSVLSTIPAAPPFQRESSVAGGTQAYIGWNVQFTHRVVGANGAAINASDFRIVNTSTTPETPYPVDLSNPQDNDYRIRLRVPIGGLPLGIYSLNYVGTDIRRATGTQIPYTHAPVTEVIAVASGEDTFSGIVSSSNSGLKRVRFTVRFNSRVSGLTPANFDLRSHESPDNSITILSNEIAPPDLPGGGAGGSPSTYIASNFPIDHGNYDSASDTFSSEWQITATVSDSSSSNAFISLAIKNFDNINPEGPATELTGTAPADPTTGRFLATAPTVSDVTPNGDTTTIGGPAHTRSWTVRFDQLTTNVNPADFQIFTTTSSVPSATLNANSIITVDPETVLGTSESATYTITVQLPDSGYVNPANIQLRTSSGQNIMGSEGATSSGNSALIRKPFAGGIITTDAADHFTLQSLALFNTNPVVLEIFNHPDVGTGTALTGGNQSLPASRPARAVWTVTYTTNPETGLSTPLSQEQRNSLFDFACSGNITQSQCDAVTHSVALVGDAYIITVGDTIFNPSTEAVSTITLISGNSGTTLTAGTVSTYPSQRLHYYPNVEAIFGDVFRTTSHLIYNFSFTTEVVGLAASEVHLGAGESIISTGAPTLTSSSNGRSYRATFALNPTIQGNESNLRLLIRDDTTPISVRNSSHRVAYSTGSSHPAYRASSPDHQFTTIPTTASAPTIETIQRVSDSTGATQAGEFINGDQDDNGNADTYYWKVTFDQPLSSTHASNPTDLFAVITSSNTDGTTRTTTSAITRTATVIDNTPNDDEFIVSFTPAASGVHETRYIHLVPLSGASIIRGAARPDPDNIANDITRAYAVDTDAILTSTTAATNRYALRTRARWASTNPLLALSANIESGNANFGDITYRANFTRPVSGLTINNFDVTASLPSVTFAVTNVVSVDGTGVDDEWNITVDATNYQLTYAGIVTLSLNSANSSSIVAEAANNVNEPISALGVPTDAPRFAYSAIPTVTLNGTQRVKSANTAISWLLTYDEDINNLGTADNFGVSINGGALQPVTVAGATKRVVTVRYTLLGTAASDQDVHLSIRPTNTLTDSSSASLSAIQLTSSATRFIYNTDNDVPTIANVIRSNSGVPITSVPPNIRPLSSNPAVAANLTAEWTVTFSHAIGSPTGTDFGIQIPDSTDANSRQIFDSTDAGFTFSVRAGSSASEWIVSVTFPATGFDGNRNVHLAILDSNTISRAGGNEVPFPKTRDVIISTPAGNAAGTNSLRIYNTKIDAPTVMNVVATNTSGVLSSPFPNIRPESTNPAVAENLVAQWTVTFSENVQASRSAFDVEVTGPSTTSAILTHGAGANDFKIEITGSGAEYVITASNFPTTGYRGDHSVNLRISSGNNIASTVGNKIAFPKVATVISTSAGNSSATVATRTYNTNVDNPTVTNVVSTATIGLRPAITTAPIADAILNATWTVTFSRDVAQPSPTDFDLAISGASTGTLTHGTGVDFVITAGATADIWNVEATLDSANSFDGAHIVNLRIVSGNTIVGGDTNAIAFGDNAGSSLLISDIGGDSSRTYNTNVDRPTVTIARVPSEGNDERIRLTGKAQWTLTFDQDMVPPTATDFSVNEAQGSLIVEAEPTGQSRVFTVTADFVKFGHDRETIIHLSTTTNSNIRRSDGNEIPFDNSVRELTSVAADNHFILNTNTTPPMVIPTDTVRVVTADRIKGDGDETVLWNIKFSEAVTNVSRRGFWH